MSDQPFTGYQVGKSNWFQSHFKPDTHVDTPDVPIPDVSWQRVVHTKNRSANSPGKTLKVKTKCNDSCGCRTENAWSNLIDGVDITATDMFPDINEAEVVANKPSKYHVPKIHRVSQQKRRSDKKSVRFTCDADNMKSGGVDKLLSYLSNSTGHDARDCKRQTFH